MAELILLTVIGTSVWVFVDAPARGLSWTWGLGCLALWIVAFPWYLVERSKLSLASSGAQPVSVAQRDTAPQWYPDPWQQAAYRYWDGYRWTGHTRAGAGL